MAEANYAHYDTKYHVTSMIRKPSKPNGQICLELSKLTFDLRHSNLLSLFHPVKLIELIYLIQLTILDTGVGSNCHSLLAKLSQVTASTLLAGMVSLDFT